MPTEKKDKKPTQSVAQKSSNLFTILVAVAAGFFGGWVGAQSDTFQTGSNSDATVQREIIASEGDLINTIAKEVGPSVVSVNVKSLAVSQDFFGFGEEIEQESAGTGVIISDDGLIITNRHVVPRDSSSVSITLSDGTEVENVEVVGRTNDNDPLDIAFLKIKDITGLTFTTAKMGDSSQVEVGDRVVAIGNALGQFQNTVTSGIISGFGRDIEAYGSGDVESLQNLFQTDAAINGGNSGGPLVNAASEIIGINVATASADNISFAIPINDVKGLIETVLEQGKLVRPYLGIRYVPITDDIAKELDLPVNRGAYVPDGNAARPSIIPNSPASKAGIEENDIIVTIDGQNLDEKNSVVSILGRKKVGDVVEVKVNRSGEEITLSVTLEAAPEQ